MLAFAATRALSGLQAMSIPLLAAVHVDGQALAFTVGIERQQGARVGDQNPMQRALRATQIFRRETGSWKLLHRHADSLIEKTAPTTVP